MTIRDWCDGQPFSYEPYGPSPCVCYTVLIAAPSGIYILLSLYHLFVVARFIGESPRPAPVHWSYILGSYLVLCSLEILFTVAFSADDKESPARAVGNFLHAVAWFLTGAKAVLITKALPRSALHIDLATWTYFLFDLVAFAVLRNSEYAEDRDGANKAAAVIHFIVGFLVLLLALLILYREHISQLYQQAIGGEDRLLVIRRFGDVYDFESLLEYIFGQRYDTAAAGAGRERYSFEETSSEAFPRSRTSTSSRGSRSKRSSSSSGIFSLGSSVRTWLRGSVDSDGQPRLDEEDIIDDDVDIEGDGSSGSSSSDGDGVYNDGEEGESSSSRRPLLSSSSAGGAGDSGKRSKKRRSSKQPGTSTSSGSSLDGYAPPTTTTTTTTSSSVLQRALERRRNKSSPYLLQPSSSTSSIGSSIHHNSVTATTAMTVGGGIEDFSVSIQRWALLRELVVAVAAEGEGGVGLDGDDYYYSNIISSSSANTNTNTSGGTSGVSRRTLSRGGEGATPTLDLMGNSNSSSNSTSISSGMYGTSSTSTTTPGGDGWAVTRHRIPSLSSPQPPFRNNNTSTTSTSNINSNTSTSTSSIQVQVEFEVSIRGGPSAETESWGNRPSSSNSSSSGISSSGISSNNSTASTATGGTAASTSTSNTSTSTNAAAIANRWTVWRTALQVEELHAVMVRY